MPELPHALAFSVERMDEETMTLAATDGQTVRWPRRLLPENLAVGSAVHLVAFADQDAEAERERLAKTVLNEMLKGQ